MYQVKVSNILTSFRRLLKKETLLHQTLHFFFGAHNYQFYIILRKIIKHLLIIILLSFD